MKTDVIWAKLNEHFNKYPQARGGGVSDQNIRMAEEQLKVVFAKSYKTFLHVYGGGCVADLYVYGLSKAEIMAPKLFSVIQNTDFYKKEQKWPDIDDWYIISDDGRGNPIGCKPDGSVWLSDHDAGFEQEKLADSFEEFLEKLLDNKLYE
jgi:hypothetical protein